MDRWLGGVRKTVERPKLTYTKEELAARLSELRDKGWITLTAHRQDKDGGIGNTLEDLLGLPENNIPIADYGEFELKTHRTSSNSLISLFRYEPEPGELVPKLLKKYGWPIPKYGPSERSLRIDIDAAGCSERGFYARIDKESKRVELHFDWAKVPDSENYRNWLEEVKKRAGLGDLEPVPYWTFDGLEEKICFKIKNMVYVSVDTCHENKKHKMKIVKARLLQGSELSKLLNGIEKGWLQIEFNARTHHNHGTGFRTWERCWPDLYSSASWLMS
jgi:hypothetical protein